MPLSSATLTPVNAGANAAITLDLSAAVVTAASVGGDAFVHQGRELLVIKNGDASPHTATIKSQANNFGTQNTADDLAVVVAAGKIAIVNPLSAAKFRDASGLVQITWDAVTSVTVKLYSIPVTA